MKLPELKEIIKRYNTEELSFLVAELYKAIPKAKKEEAQIDALILNPSSTGKAEKAEAKKNQTPDLLLLQFDISSFLTNVKDGNYTSPNRIVSKAERPKWRFKVKAFIKDLEQVAKNPDDRKVAAEFLQQLYELMCKACYYSIFSAEYPFKAIGIGQDVFLLKVIEMQQKVQPIKQYVTNAMRLIVNNALHYDMQRIRLTRTFITTLLKDEEFYLAIQCAAAYREEFKQKLVTPTKKADLDESALLNKISNINDFIFECYAALDDFEPAIADQKANGTNAKRNKEIDVYILVSKLFYYKQKDYIVEVLDKAVVEDIKLRASLIKLKEAILTTGELPNFF
jgi:hypothetical protein